MTPPNRPAPKALFARASASRIAGWMWWTRELLHTALALPPDDVVSPADTYIAPHSDDVCYSLGALASSRRHGRLVTVCTRAMHVAPHVPVPADPAAREQAVTDLRTAEDARFAAACGLQVIDLGLRDSTARGRAPFQDALAPGDWQPIEAALLNALTAEGPHRPWLFCPAGIGGHLDHLAVRRAVVDHMAALRQRYRIAFYEDLPYASRSLQRACGIVDLHRAVDGLRRYAFTASGALRAKPALIGLYASQLYRPLHDLRRFTPAVPRRRVLHEAIWTCETL